MLPKYIVIGLTALGLAACTPTPQPDALEPAGRPTVNVAAKPVEFFLQGYRGRGSRPPEISALTITFNCLRDFDGRSAQERADRSVQYSTLYRDRATEYLINPRIKGGWLREIQRHSVPNEGCDPQYKTLFFETVTQDPREIIKFMVRHPGARAFLRR